MGLNDIGAKILLAINQNREEYELRQQRNDLQKELKRISAQKNITKPADLAGKTIASCEVNWADAFLIFMDGTFAKITGSHDYDGDIELGFSLVDSREIKERNLLQSELQDQLTVIEAKLDAIAEKEKEANELRNLEELVRRAKQRLGADRLRGLLDE